MKITRQAQVWTINKKIHKCFSEFPDCGERFFTEPPPRKHTKLNSASLHLLLITGSLLPKLLLGYHILPAVCVWVCVEKCPDESRCRMKGKNTQRFLTQFFFVYKEGVERVGGVLVYKQNQVGYNHHH